jgi:hypothetical protein
LIEDGMLTAALMDASPFGNLNFFRRHQEKPADESQPFVQPLPSPEACPKSEPVKPIQINDEKYALLLKALRPRDKNGRVLKDLAVDGLNAMAVIGGASQASHTNPPPVMPHDSPGPIV